MLTLNTQFPGGDVGVLASLFLNRVSLSAGQAVSCVVCVCMCVCAVYVCVCVCAHAHLGACVEATSKNTIALIQPFSATTLTDLFGCQ